MVRFYQGTISNQLGGACRFHPSCSHYAIEAIEKHNPGFALFLIAKRILKCRPFGPSGLDPVPAPCTSINNSENLKYESK